MDFNVFFSIWFEKTVHIKCLFTKDLCTLVDLELFLPQVFLFIPSNSHAKQFMPAKVLPSYFLFLLFLAVITGLISEGGEFSSC